MRFSYNQIAAQNKVFSTRADSKEVVGVARNPLPPLSARPSAQTRAKRTQISSARMGRARATRTFLRCVTPSRPALLAGSAGGLLQQPFEQVIQENAGLRAYIRELHAHSLAGGDVAHNRLGLNKASGNFKKQR